MKSNRRRNGNITIITPDDVVHINVSGMQYVVLKKTLDQFPTTLLGNAARRRHYYVDFMNAYFFDRNRVVFESVLYFYQTAGTLIRPSDIPMEFFATEVRFYGIPEEVLVTLQRKEGYLKNVVDSNAEKPPENYWQRKIWRTMEYPESSMLARMIACFSTFIIMVTIVTFCIETLPQYKSAVRQASRMKETNNTDNSTGLSNATEDIFVTQHLDHAHEFTESSQFISFHRTIEIIDTVSIIWFVIEYLVRLISAPNKWQFFRSFLNLIDLFAILPYFLILYIKTGASSSLGLLRILRLVRVFRVFKLSRHSLGLQVMGSTLRASINELVMVVVMVGFSIIIFSSAIYYAEYNGDNDYDGDESTFSSIPDAFWYTLVTMTTVGYGDYVPKTLLGKLIGGACAVNGVLVVAMVVPVIVNNFEFFYKRDRINRAKREEERSTYEQVSLSDALVGITAHLGE